MPKIDLNLLDEDVIDEKDLFVPGGKLAPDPHVKKPVRKSFVELNKAGRKDRRGSKDRVDPKRSAWPV